MSNELVLTAPATVAIHVPGVGRTRVRFDAGRVKPSDDPAEQAAVDHLRYVLARGGDAAGIPDTIDAVKDWVGSDPTRAAVALDAERARSQGPRKSLEPWLAGLAGPDDDPDAGATGDDQES